MTMGQRIKSARKKAKMTQDELARKLNVPFQSISQWERNVRNPKRETLEKIANALGVSVFSLMGVNEHNGFVSFSIPGEVASAIGLPVDGEGSVTGSISRDSDIGNKIMDYLALGKLPDEQCVEKESISAHNTPKHKTETFQPFTETDDQLIKLGGFSAFAEFYNLPEEIQKEAMKDIQGFVEYTIEKYKKKVEDSSEE